MNSCQGPFYSLHISNTKDAKTNTLCETTTTMLQSVLNVKHLALCSINTYDIVQVVGTLLVLLQKHKLPQGSPQASVSVCS